MPDPAPLQTVNPATGEPGEAYPAATLGQALEAAAAAHGAFLQWRRLSFADRAAPLRDRLIAACEPLLASQAP